MLITEPEEDMWSQDVHRHAETMFVEDPDVWLSSVLGPDGQPLAYEEEKQQIGFILRPSKKD
jgi:hypothetical protein